MDKSPLVSCVCVTRARPDKLKNAILMFLSQDYPNKELIVVCDEDDMSSISTAREMNFEPLIYKGQGRSLGETRNFAVNNSSGYFICQWDDDDWYHPKRLSTQIESMIFSGQRASALTNWIIFEGASSTCYLSLHRIWEGSLIYEKSILTSIKYPREKLGEDTIFANKIMQLFGILPVVAPYLYIYRVHKSNSWSKHTKHFEMMFAQSQKLPPSIGLLVAEKLDNFECYGYLATYLGSKEFLSKLHFLKFNNLNYSNHQLIEYMNKIDSFDRKHFQRMAGIE